MPTKEFSGFGGKERQRQRDSQRQTDRQGEIQELVQAAGKPVVGAVQASWLARDRSSRCDGLKSGLSLQTGWIHPQKERRTPGGRGHQRPDLGSQLPRAPACGWSWLGPAGHALCLRSLVRAKDVCAEKLMNERLLWGEGEFYLEELQAWETYLLIPLFQTRAGL